MPVNMIKTRNASMSFSLGDVVVLYEFMSEWNEVCSVELEVLEVVAFGAMLVDLLNDATTQPLTWKQCRGKRVAVPIPKFRPIAFQSSEILNSSTNVYELAFSFLHEARSTTGLYRILAHVTHIFSSEIARSLLKQTFDPYTTCFRVSHRRWRWTFLDTTRTANYTGLARRFTGKTE